MSSRTRAQPLGGGEAAFVRIVLLMQDYTFQANSIGSVANRAWAHYIELKHGGVVTKLGIKVNDTEALGNIQLGLYDSAFNRICVTAITPTAALLTLRWNWIATTTNPLLQAGYYWVAFVCDQNYVNGVSGCLLYMNDRSQTDMVDSADLGNWGRVRMDNAYPLPDPLVPVNDNNSYVLAMGIEI